MSDEGQVTITVAEFRADPDRWIAEERQVVVVDDDGKTRLILGTVPDRRLFADADPLPDFGQHHAGSYDPENNPWLS